MGGRLVVLVLSSYAACVYCSAGSSNIGQGQATYTDIDRFVADPGPRQLLDKSDAARTAAFTIVQGEKGCAEFPGFLWYFANSTTETPLRSLDVYALDTTGLECVTNLTNSHPGYIRRVVNLSSADKQVRAKFRPEARGGSTASSVRPRRLWPSRIYQYIIWVVYEELLAEGVHVIHFDTDVIILGDLWTNLVTPLRAGYDIITTCDNFGPGSERSDKLYNIINRSGYARGCAFNPAVQFMRNCESVRAFLSWMMENWDSQWIDATTHQVGNKFKKADSHLISDMFQQNIYFRNCYRKPLDRAAPREDKQIYTSLIRGQNGWKCNNATLFRPDTYLTTWSAGYLRHGRPNDCGDEEHGYADACRRMGIFIYHHHARGLYGLAREGLSQPWPPIARPAPAAAEAASAPAGAPPAARPTAPAAGAQAASRAEPRLGAGGAGGAGGAARAAAVAAGGLEAAAPAAARLCAGRALPALALYALLLPFLWRSVVRGDRAKLAPRGGHGPAIPGASDDDL